MLFKKSLCVLITSVFSTGILLASPANTQVAVVDNKACFESSKQGKEEISQLEAMNNQLASIMESKDAELKEMVKKWNDNEYRDSLSKEAEKELQERILVLKQEFAQYQSQFFQTLQQSKFELEQKVLSVVAKASEQVAKEKNIDVVFIKDVCFFYGPSLDITKEVLTKMDEVYEEEKEKTSSNAQPSSLENENKELSSQNVNEDTALSQEENKELTINSKPSS